MAEKEEVIDAPAESAPVAEASTVDEPAGDRPAGEAPTSGDPFPPTVIVVDAPVEPRKKGNRLLSVLLAIPATLVFIVILVGVAFVIPGFAPQGFLTRAEFYFPAMSFFVGLVLVGAALNRAGWWSHIVGSVVVGAIVWAGTASLVLLSGGVLSMTRAEANEVFLASFFSPSTVIAALLAREIAIWTGAVLSRRGRVLKVRNAEARAAFEKETAELVPTSG